MLIEDVATGEVTSVGAFEYALDYLVIDGSRRRGYGMPLRQGLRVTSTLDGLVVAVGNDPVLRRYTPEGVLRDTVVLPIELQPVTEADIEAAIERRLAPYTDPRDIAERREAYESMPYPEHYPVFSEMLPDEVGGLWLEEFTEHLDLVGSRWLAVNRSGEVVARITLPAGFRLTQIGRDFVLGVTQDDFDLTHVVRYDLDRR